MPNSIDYYDYITLSITNVDTAWRQIDRFYDIDIMLGKR